MRVSLQHFFCDYNMEDSVVDRTIIAWRQNQLGQMADFPPLLKFIYSEKATKFCEIFTLLLTTVH